MKIIDALFRDKSEILKNELIVRFCPSDFGYGDGTCCRNCRDCWDREIEEKESEIK